MSPYRRVTTGAAAAAILAALVAARVEGAVHTVAYMDATAIQTTSEWTNAKPADRGERQFIEAMLAAHNGLRKSLGVSDLIWDSGLAKDAEAYAAQIANSRRFEHSASLPKVSEGENLWMGTRLAYSYAEMLGAWSDEGTNFVKGPFPQVSKTGSWHDAGHYTQMIWAGTRSFGCAVASNADDDFLVCRYFPAGNVYGADVFAQEPKLALRSSTKRGPAI